jgi:hypothetical protein
MLTLKILISVAVLLAVLAASGMSGMRFMLK